MGLEAEHKYADWFFQLAQAANAATIVSGSLAERVHIPTYLVFSFYMTSFIYPIVVAWTWGGGFLSKMGFHDFAGSGIVHLVGGAAGMVGAIIAGPRLGRFKPIRGKGIPDVDAGKGSKTTYETVVENFKRKDWDMVRINQFARSYSTRLSDGSVEAANSPSQAVFGTLILWLGWLMFNSGSSHGVVGAKGDVASLVVVNTILAPSAGGIVTFVLLFRRFIVEDKGVRMDFQALTNGILAGLVSITASCNVVEPWAAIVIGALGAVCYCLSCRLMNCLQIDDPLEATQVHGFCGIWGCIAAALFKREKGIFYEGENSTEFLGVQLLGCLIIIGWSSVVSGLFFIIAKSVGYLRIPEENEILGCDLYYFSPIEFSGTIDQFDIKTDIEMSITKPLFLQMDSFEEKAAQQPNNVDKKERNNSQYSFSRK